jgi:hypothetical protein
MRQMPPPFRNVRSEELRRFAACERGLAESYRRWARRRAPEEALLLERLSSECEEHARLLGDEVRALGGRAAAEADGSWIITDDPGEAAHRALATYRDHLDDFDGGTVGRLAGAIVEHHREAFRYFTRDVMRDSEL